MRKIVKLTERDLNRLVRRVIKEQQDSFEDDFDFDAKKHDVRRRDNTGKLKHESNKLMVHLDGFNSKSDIKRLVNKVLVEQISLGALGNALSGNAPSRNTLSGNKPSEQQLQINELITAESKKVKNYYQQHYSKPDIVDKFENKNNINVIKKYITTIKYRLYSENSGKFGFVTKKDPWIINLNVNLLFTKQGNNIVPKGSSLYDTILHEMAHSIDYKMKELGEKTITSSSGYYNPTGEKDSYVQSEMETFARIQRLRKILGLSPTANGYDIKEKLIQLIKSKKLTLPNVKVYGNNSPNGLLFEPTQRTKGVLTDLWRFYSPMKINGTIVPDIAALFGKYSSIQNNGSIFLNLDIIGEVNDTTAAIPNPDSMTGYV